MTVKIKSKGKQFKELHLTDAAFIMANAWNAGSAVMLEHCGFKAIGTTSAGIAFCRGLPDYEGALRFEDALEETNRISAAVDVPVSMDAENGYGHDPEDISINVLKIAKAGAVGASIEDYTGIPEKPLYDLSLAVERIKAAKLASIKFDFDFTLTARAECYLVGHSDPFAEAIRRINLYREAGADCLYVPGIKDIDTVKELVKEASGPINVVVGLTGSPLTFEQLEDAGVKRISIGGSLARVTFGLIKEAADEMLQKGSFSFSNKQIPDVELCRLFAAKQVKRRRI